MCVAFFSEKGTLPAEADSDSRVFTTDARTPRNSITGAEARCGTQIPQIFTDATPAGEVIADRRVLLSPLNLCPSVKSVYQSSIGRKVSENRRRALTRDATYSVRGYRLERGVSKKDAN